VLSLPPQRTSILASGALILAIGAIIFAFVLGSTHNADAQFTRTNSAVQPHATAVVWVSQDKILPVTNFPVGLSVDCPPGFSVASGGWQYSPNDDKIVTNMSYPSPNRKSWEVIITNRNLTAKVYKLYASCVM
jgi:hypothetical protein